MARTYDKPAGTRQIWAASFLPTISSIVVAPDGGFSGYYSDWYNAGSGGPPMYETYDIDQLIPLIDAHFRTIASRAGRAVIGESMGGYGVMTYAVRHPDLFGAAVSMSGFVDSNYAPEIALISGGPLSQAALPDSIYGPRATQEVRWHGHNPTDLADNLRDLDIQVRSANGIPTWISARIVACIRFAKKTRASFLAATSSSRNCTKRPHQVGWLRSWAGGRASRTGGRPGAHRRGRAERPTDRTAW